jgi:hypothetical protein
MYLSLVAFGRDTYVTSISFKQVRKAASRFIFPTAFQHRTLLLSGIERTVEKVMCAS